MHFKQLKSIPNNSFCSQTINHITEITGCLPASSQLQIAKFTFPLKSNNFESGASLYQGFNPSSVNLLRIGLLTDSLLLYGYLLEMGGKDDNLKIIYRKNQTDSILFQSKSLFNKSSNTLIYKCINSDSQLHFFWRLPDSAFNQIHIKINSQLATQISQLTYWGAELWQSGTTAAGKTKISNIYVGNYWNDTLPPAVSKILSYNNGSLKIEFSEPLQIPLNPLPSIQINSNTIRYLSKANQISPNCLLLDSFTPFCNQTIQIQLLGIQDTAGNNINSAQTTQFHHRCSNNLSPKMIAVTEIMYKPNPSKGTLPNSQYIEIKNLTHSGFWLDSLRISDPYTTGAPIKNHWLNPQSFALLIPAKDTALWQTFPKNQVIPFSPWPTFNTTSDTLTLSNPKKEILAQIPYVNADLSSPYNNGGYSIEKANQNLICIDLLNWQNNQNTGGTPLSTSIDQQQICPPQNRILSATLNNNSLHLTLLFPMDSAQWNNIQLQLINTQDSSQKLQILSPSINPSHNPSTTAEIIIPYNKTITNPFKIQETQFQSTEDFLQNTPLNIALQISNLQDCSNNLANPQNVHWISTQFSIPPLENSLKISEIMFNNQEDFPDYIEIANTSKQSFNTDDIEIQYFNGQDSSLQFVIPLKEIQSVIGGNQTWLLSNNSHKLYRQFQATPFENFKTSYSMGNLLAEKGILQIVNRKSQHIFDRVAYHQDWHHPALTQTKGLSLERINLKNNGLIPSSWMSSCNLPHEDGIGNKFCANYTINNNGSPGYQLQLTAFTPPSNNNWIKLIHPIFSYGNSTENPIFSFNQNYQITQFQALIYTLNGKFISYVIPLQWVDPNNPLPLQNLPKLSLPPGNYVLFLQASDIQFKNYHKKIIVTILP